MHLLILALKPLIRDNLAQAVPQVRIRHQNVFNEALRLLGEIACDLVSRVKDFLIQTLRVGVLKWQVATE